MTRTPHERPCGNHQICGAVQRQPLLPYRLQKSQEPGRIFPQIREPDYPLWRCKAYALTGRIKLKGLNVDKLRAEYQALETQKKELTATYKSCEKEVRDLKRKQENLNQYLGRTQTDPVQEQFKKKNNPIL